MIGALILPGLHDSDADHWQSRWEARDPSLRRVVQDDWETPRCADWLERLDVAVDLAGPHVVLVAHSLACALVARGWAAGARHRVRGALLVAAADTEASSFPSGPRGFAPMALRRLDFRSVVVASADDPFVTLERAAEFATAWGSAFVNVGYAGHINSASGFGDWPQGLALLRKLQSESGSDSESEL